MALRRFAVLAFATSSGKYNLVIVGGINIFMKLDYLRCPNLFKCFVSECPNLDVISVQVISQD